MESKMKARHQHYQWKQQIINSSVDVNRAVFELNCNADGSYFKKHGVHKEPSRKYLLECVTSAIESLTIARQYLSGQVELKFDDDE